jgi:hypothetical protein
MISKFKYFYYFLLVGFISTSVTASPPADVLQEANNSFIFVLSDQVPAHEVPGLAKGLVEQYGGTVRHTYSTVIRGFSAHMSEQAASLMASQNPKILSYARNGIVFAGKQPNGNKGKGPEPAEQIIPWGIQRVGGPGDGTGRHAWVLDTGIDLENQDLDVSEGTGKNCLTRGKDTINDNNGHGTQNAGIIAALNNDIDVVGVAAGATVHPVKVLHNNLYGYFDEIICGIDHVASTFESVDAKPAHNVVNMSIYAVVEGQEAGVQLMEQAIRNVINEKGLRFSVCAGNESDDAANYSPARMTDPNVYTVTAINENDQLYSQGNYGSLVNWAAPGVSITSLKAGGGLITWSGCSYAVPHVSGILLLGEDPVVDGYVRGADGVDMPIATITGASAQ